MFKPRYNNMDASVQYNDFKGTAAADISDYLPHGDNIGSIARYFKLDMQRFKPVGISIYGVKKFRISLICVDNERSEQGKEHIVKMYCDTSDDDEILNTLFKRLNVVLYNRFDTHYPALDYDEEASFSDYHGDGEIEEEE